MNSQKASSTAQDNDQHQMKGVDADTKLIHL
jgi:hypothetical protein